MYSVDGGGLGGDQTGATDNMLRDDTGYAVMTYGDVWDNTYDSLATTLRIPQNDDRSWG